MPFAGFDDWDDCMESMKNKGKSSEEAKKICGKLQAKEESHELRLEYFRIQQKRLELLKELIKRSKE